MQRNLAMITMAVALMGAHVAWAQVETADWADALNRQVYHGQTHVATKAGIADVLADKNVVVIATAENAEEKIGELTKQTEATGREGVLILVLENGDNLTRIADIDKKAKRAGLTMEVAQTMVQSAPEGYAKPANVKNPAGVRKAKAGKAEKAEADSPAATTAGTSAAAGATKIAAGESGKKNMETFWINTKTGKRHNKDCRYYGKGKNGKPCRKDEGTPCGVCGG